MKTGKAKKPEKLKDQKLFKEIENAIETTQYIFTNHATERAIERKISTADVLRILKGEFGYYRKRKKSKDEFDENFKEWKYCIEGKTADKNVRVIITFDEDYMPIITVIDI